MKPRKIHRNRHTFRRRRFNLPWKEIGLVCILAILVVGGIFAAKGLHSLLSSKSDIPKADTSSVSDTTDKTTAKTAATTAQEEVSSLKVENVKAFVMSYATFIDKDKREAQITEAAKAGFTGVLFDLKDGDGTVLYASSSKTAETNGAISASAISKDDLKAFLSFCKSKDVLCIPRLYCFKDKTAAYKMAAARVQLQGEPKYMWLDNTAANGGKPWLNPYAPEAHAYLQEFIKELSGIGFNAICLDAVQFPDVMYLASYGNTSLSNLSKLDVLGKFVKDSQKIAGNCKLMVVAAGLSTFSDSTAIYGGNPLNFGASIVSPELFPSYFGKKLTTGTETLYSPGTQPGEATKMALSQIKLRIELMEKDKPQIVPFLQVFSYTDEQVASEIQSLKSVYGKNAGFILYSYDGSYAFSNYKT